MLSIHGIVQIFGVLDVERVAGNFHISMHGLSNYVAQQVGYPCKSDISESLGPQLQS
jgi:hypothetical protein